MNKSVLVVEDEAGVRRALRRLLADRGLSTIEAGNGREAIQRLNEETPAAIVIDLLMPVMSGAELLKALRRNPFYRRIPTVVMTGALDSEQSSVSEVLGVPVIFKPNLERLPEILLGLIERSGASSGVSRTPAMATTTQAPRIGDFDVAT
jgi:CheY-like chemotaxis protein